MTKTGHKRLDIANMAPMVGGFSTAKEVGEDVKTLLTGLKADVEKVCMG